MPVLPVEPLGVADAPQVHRVARDRVVLRHRAVGRQAQQLAPEGLRVLRTIRFADVAGAAGAVGDEGVASWQECYAPRHFEAVDDRLEAHLRLPFRAEAFPDQLAFRGARSCGYREEE